jgi:hypothetical protein
VISAIFGSRASISAFTALPSSMRGALFFARLRDERGDLVLAGALRSSRHDALAALLVGREQGVDVEVLALVRDGRADEVGVLANEGDVEHDGGE